MLRRGGEHSAPELAVEVWRGGGTLIRSLRGRWRKEGGRREEGEEGEEGGRKEGGDGMVWEISASKSAHTALAVKACLLGCKQLH